MPSPLTPWINPENIKNSWNKTQQSDETNSKVVSILDWSNIDSQKIEIWENIQNNIFLSADWKKILSVNQNNEQVILKSFENKIKIISNNSWVLHISSKYEEWIYSIWDDCVNTIIPLKNCKITFLENWLVLINNFKKFTIVENTDYALLWEYESDRETLDKIIPKRNNVIIWNIWSWKLEKLYETNNRIIAAQNGNLIILSNDIWEYELIIFKDWKLIKNISLNEELKTKSIDEDELNNIIKGKFFSIDWKIYYFDLEKNEFVFLKNNKNKKNPEIYDLFQKQYTLKKWFVIDDNWKIFEKKFLRKKRDYDLCYYNINEVHIDKFFDEITL